VFFILVTQTQSYSNFTVARRIVISMPPDGYTTITITEETTERLAQLMIQHELETVSEAVEYAVDSALTNDCLSD
jgi:hypothetical protein